MGRRLISCCMALLMLGCALAEDELDITYRFGSREEQKIAVTIDDCYHAEDVRAVLDILQANDVRAFVSDCVEVFRDSVFVFCYECVRAPQNISRRAVVAV